MEHLKYPIGKFEYGKTYSFDEIQKNILIIEAFPNLLKSLVTKLSSAKLETTYRPDGWTAKQVIHHLADSHTNAYIRVKLALTEASPIIKPYREELWAELEDGKNAPIEISISLIEAIHLRWVILLKSMREVDFNKTYIHPQYNREFKLGEFLALYVWHGNHHFAHLKIILEK